MNYITLLNENEVALLCNIITGKGFKTLFHKYPKDFSKIKPGFRASSISDKEALSLAIKHADKEFISSFINTSVQKWIEEIEEHCEKLKSLGLDDFSALAETLADSVFSDHIELYFLLSQKEVDDEYLKKMAAQIPKKRDTNVEEAEAIDPSSSPAMEAADAVLLREQLSECTQKICVFETQIKSIQEEKDRLERDYANAQQEIQLLQQHQVELETELAELRARAIYDDTSESSSVSTNSEYDYISICEVINPDYNGQRIMIRLADIDRKGTIDAFYESEDVPKTFGNRLKLYYKQGPAEPGVIGVWNWSAIPNNNDPSRDYIISSFNAGVRPIEIAIIPDCASVNELLEILKGGISFIPSTTRVLVTAYLSRSQYVGFLCRNIDFVQSNNGVKLSPNVISLPRYEFGGKDVVRTSNGKVFYRTLSIGIPLEIVNVKDPFDIVKTIIISRNSWQSFKNTGKTRSEWKTIRDFLGNLDVTTIVDDIVDAINCSRTEAQKMLDEFIEYADTYIDGTSIEDKIISAVVIVNPELTERCKALIMDDWIEENQTAVADATETLENLQNQIRETRLQFDKEYADAKEKFAKQKEEANAQLALVKEEHDKLQAALVALNDDIAAKKQLATDVETAIEQRIIDAQTHAAEFIAGLSFIPKIIVAQTEHHSEEINVTSQRTIEDHESASYVFGRELNAEDLEQCNTWNEMLNVISDELVEAGVMPKYALPLAAYMYSAYISRYPLLLIGPNSSAIVDAFSGAVSGRTAGILDCTEKYNHSAVKLCCSSEDSIVKIVNPFNSNWIERINSTIDIKSKYYIAVTPFSEDIQIEPKSLYSYMLPVMTEVFVEKTPTGHLLGGYCSQKYKEFSIVKPTKSHNSLFSEMHVIPLVKTRMQLILSNMHEMIGDKNVDYDVLFTLLPYAFATMQMPFLIKAVRDDEKNLVVSNDLLKLIDSLYGETE